MDAVEDIDASYVDHGYIDEDGFTIAQTRSTEKKKAFGGSVVKVIQTEFENTWKFKFLETVNADVLKTVYGDSNVQLTPATPTHGLQTRVAVNKKQLPLSSWVIDVIDGDRHIRFYAPRGQITEVGDITVVHTDIIKYEVTIQNFEDDEGNTSYILTDDGQKVA